MRAPKILNDGGEGGVIEPHSFEAERFRTVGMQVGGGGGKKNRVVVEGYSRKVANMGVVEEKVPLGV